MGKKYFDMFETETYHQCRDKCVANMCRRRKYATGRGRMRGGILHFLNVFFFTFEQWSCCRISLRRRRHTKRWIFTSGSQRKPLTDLRIDRWRSISNSKNCIFISLQFNAFRSVRILQLELYFRSTSNLLEWCRTRFTGKRIEFQCIVRVVTLTNNLIWFFINCWAHTHLVVALICVRKWLLWCANTEQAVPMQYHSDYISFPEEQIFEFVSENA